MFFLVNFSAVLLVSCRLQVTLGSTVDAVVRQCDGHKGDACPANQNDDLSSNAKVPQPDVNVKDKMLETKSPPPSIWNHHLHVMYIEDEPAQLKSALDFRHLFIDHFNLTNAPFCASLMHDEHLCVWNTTDNVGPPTDPGNPFTVNEWGAFIPLDRFAEVVMWTNLNRGDNVVLIHPNTGYERNDHAKWSMWSGGIYPLRLSALCEYCISD